MRYGNILTDKKTAAVCAWFIFELCSAAMCIISICKGWRMGVCLMAAVFACVAAVVTFHPGVPIKAQATVLMLMSYINVFTCSIMEDSIYNSVAVFIEIAVVLSAYRDTKLLFCYIMLVLSGVIHHIVAMTDINLSNGAEITKFVVRISMMITALIVLYIFIEGLNTYEKMLIQSVQDAKKAEHSKADFLANMSHEIRTPMNAIVGMCELVLREDDLSDNVRSNCCCIRAAGESLLAIINDILDFSKIDSGKFELVPDEFNIASTINAAISMAETRRGSKNIEFIVNADPNIPRGIIGDESRIRQVIVNLMTNAVKYTEKGSITLTVSQTRQEYGINLFVSVADTGIGITEEHLDKLYTSFYRVDTKKNHSVEGTGLGLAISKKIIDQMGGFISVKSKYGVGSDFRFVIPLKVKDSEPFIAVKEPQNVCAAAFLDTEGRCSRAVGNLEKMEDMLHVEIMTFNTAEKLKAAAERRSITHLFVSREKYLEDPSLIGKFAETSNVYVVQERAGAVTLPNNIHCIYKPFYSISAVSAFNNENIVTSRNMQIKFTAPEAKILIVDDNALNLKVAAGLMKPYRMQLFTAESGARAIEMLRAEKFDLVFMDHMMPEMDGVETTKIIRNQNGEYFRSLPIIALTANAVNGAREMFISSGMNDFLAKPIEVEMLDKMLRNYLPKRCIRTAEPQKEAAKRRKEVLV